MRKDFETYCKEFIIDNIEEYENQTVYACDLAYTLAEGINADGTATYNRAEAIAYICEWWYDASDYSDYEKDNFGERSNPFKNPEAFMVRMVIEGVNIMLSRCTAVDEAWNDELTLTKDVIESIKADIENASIEF